jgi:hypothetical protein
MNNETASRQPSRVLKWAIIIALIVVLNLFFNYAITLVYPSPQFENFCPSRQVENMPTTQEECLAVGGQWNQRISPEAPAAKTPTTAPLTESYCNTTYSCQNSFNNAENTYNRSVFIVLVILGIASLVIGTLLKTSDAISAGLSLGGVLSLIIASARYWTEAANILKVVILAVALVALIWLGLKKFRN